MAFVAVDKDESEWIFDVKPDRAKNIDEEDIWNVEPYERDILLPNGSIEKLIGKKLTWEDEPVDLKETKIVCRCGKNTREDAGCLECGERATLREVEDE